MHVKAARVIAALVRPARLLLVGLTLLAGCYPNRRAWEPRVDAHPGQHAAYVVVALGGPLYEAPDSRAPTVPLLASEAARSPWGAAFATFRVLREQNGWAEIETLGGPGDGHCAVALPELEAFRLRLYVPARAIAPVNTREVTQRFADGTSIALARGVPLEPLPGTGLFRARFGGHSAVVRVPTADVGTRYLMSETPAHTPAHHVLSGAAVASASAVLGQTGRLEGDGEDLLVYARRELSAAELLVEVRPPCARLEVRVPAHVVREHVALQIVARRHFDLHDSLPEPAVPAVPQSPEHIVPEAPGRVAPVSQAPVNEPAPGRSPFVERGAEIAWASGRSAGVVARRTQLGRELDAAGGRRCFAVGADVDVPLCFAAADLEDPSAGAAARLAPPAALP